MTLPALIGNGLAWFLVWLFAQAAFHKFSASAYYQQLIHRYVSAVPASRVWVLMIASLEAGIALALLVPQWRDGALPAAALLLLAYAGLMTSQILRGESGMQCGCAGPDSQLGISWALVVRNGVCALLALLAMAPASSLVAGWAGIGLSLFVAIFAVLVYETSEQLISNAQWMAGEG